MTEEGKGPAAVENLDALLPEVKPEPVETRPRGSVRKGKIIGAETEAHRIVRKARTRFEEKSRQQRKSQLYGTASTYDFVHDRLHFALGSDDPAAAIARLQASLSLLTWELGQILDDITIAEKLEKKAK